MAFSILSLGRLMALPLSIASRRRGLKLGSPPPILAATVISLAILEKAAPRFSSWRPLRCWMLAHLECPAIVVIPFLESQWLGSGAGFEIEPQLETHFLVGPAHAGLLEFPRAPFY